MTGELPDLPVDLPTGLVSIETAVDDGGSSGRGRMTMLRLSWRPDDPLAVEVVVTAFPDHPALPRGRWVVLRDFLRYGLEEPTGDGNVRIIPDGQRVAFHLVQAGRPARLSLPCQTVADFLDETESVVPAGEERSDLALDALIERLLRS